VHREFSATGYVVGCRIAEHDLAELAPAVGVGKYAALEFEDGAARLLVKVTGLTARMISASSSGVGFSSRSSDQGG
jgi:hypothetical protein